MPLIHGPLEWRRYKTVVFDLDGTLYDQRQLRLRMILALARECLRTRDLGLLFAIQAFRKCREQLSDRDTDEFMTKPIEIAATKSGRSKDEVERIVSEWIEVRPLAYLKDCVFPGVNSLIQGLRSSGTLVGILSDYPAREKIAAMGIAADIIVSATDPDIRRLKPNPQGLLKILSETGAAAQECLVIGDRVERDALVAACCGVRALIRSTRSNPRYDTFRSYSDDIFRPVFDGA